MPKKKKNYISNGKPKAKQTKNSVLQWKKEDILHPLMGDLGLNQ